jgi:acyl carrier protein
VIPDGASAILEMVAASFADARGISGMPILAGDRLSDLGLSHLRLLAVLIKLEDKFAIEFPTDAINSFRIVGDIVSYIESHEMTRYEDAADEYPTTAIAPAERPPFAHDRLHWVWARPRVDQPGWRPRQREGWSVRELSRLLRDALATTIGVWAISRQR